MRKVNVLQVVGSLKIGGLENVAMNIIRYSDRERFAFSFVVYGEEVGVYEKEVAELGGKVFHVDFPHNGLNKFKQSLKKIICESGPYDIVHSHNLFNSGIILQVAKECGIPVRIAHAHTNRNDSNIPFTRRAFQWLMRHKLNKYATHMFACSQRAGSYLFGKRFLSEGIIYNNGVLTNRFHMAGDFSPVALKKSLGIEETAKIIGHTGRFDPVKNHKLLIDYFTEIRQILPETKLLLVGDGPLLDESKKYAKENGLEDAVVFTGRRADIPQLLSIMDVFVMPSVYEGVSVSLIEAQCAGVPYIVSESAYSKESNVTGYGTAIKLSESKEVWVEEIIRQLLRPNNTNAIKQVKEKGYDLVDVVKKLNNNYIKYLN